MEPRCFVHNVSRSGTHGVQQAGWFSRVILCRVGDGRLESSLGQRAERLRSAPEAGFRLLPAFRTGQASTSSIPVESPQLGARASTSESETVGSWGRGRWIRGSFFETRCFALGTTPDPDRPVS